MRLAFFLSVPRVPLGDVYHHVMIAANLVHGTGYSHSPGPPYYPDLQRAPLVPVLLAGLIALSKSAWLPLLFILQCLFDVGTALIIRRHFGALPMAIYFLAPYPAFFPSLPMTECVSVFLFTLALDRAAARQSWQLGLVTGLCALSRPALLPIAFLIILATARRKQLAIALVTAGLVLLPWAVRNASIPGGRFTPLIITGFGAGLWSGVTQDGGLMLTDKGGDLMQTYLVQWHTNEDLPTAEVLRTDAELKKLAFEAIAHNPLRYAGHVLAQCGRFWWRADDALVNSPVFFPFLFGLAQWSQRLLVLLALPALLLDRRALAICVLLTLPYALIHVEARYMLPAEPILAVMASRLKETLNRPRNRQQVAP